MPYFFQNVLNIRADFLLKVVDKKYTLNVSIVSLLFIQLLIGKESTALMSKAY